MQHEADETAAAGGAGGAGGSRLLRGNAHTLGGGVGRGAAGSGRAEQDAVSKDQQHEAAIFGAPAPMQPSSDTRSSERRQGTYDGHHYRPCTGLGAAAVRNEAEGLRGAGLGFTTGSGLASSSHFVADAPQLSQDFDDPSNAGPSADAPSLASTLDAKVLTVEKGVSWRERAARARGQRLVTQA